MRSQNEFSVFDQKLNAANEFIQILVVDDEELLRKKFYFFLKKIRINLKFKIFEASEVQIAKEIIKKNKIQIIFLNSEIPSAMGFDLFRDAKKNGAQIILQANHTEYAAKAFELGAKDYLVKPIKYERFLLALERALKALGQESFTNKDLHIIKRKNIKKTYSDILVLSSHNEKKLINFHDIRTIQSINSYSEVKTCTNSYITVKSLNTLESLLDKDLFFRVSRSHIINLNFFDRIVTEKNGFYVQLKDGILLKMSRTRHRSLSIKLRENFIHI